MRRNDGKKIIRGPAHGGAKNKEPLYGIFAGIKSRCYNQKYPAYSRYGARGIRMCDEWLYSYPAFKEWSLASGYQPGLTLDRINNNGNYEPGNCQWLTRSSHGSKTNLETKNKPLAESSLSIDAKTASMIKHLLNAGFRACEISDRFHVTRCVVQNICDASAWSEVEPQLIKQDKKSQTVMTPELVSTVMEMLNAGVTKRDIAIKIGCSVATVYNIQRGHSAYV